MKYKNLICPTILLAGSITFSQAAVTYLDATTSNTTLDGTPLVLGTNYTTGANSGSNGDDLWNLRTNLDTNGGDAWTNNHEETTRLATTFELPGTGQYEIFGYFWIGKDGSNEWETEFELGNAAGTPVTYTKSNATALTTLPGIDTHFTGNTIVYDAAYDMFEVSLGVWNATDENNLTVTVYVNRGTSPDTEDQRTRYDGVGYQAVPEPATYALLSGLCALTLIALRRRQA